VRQASRRSWRIGQRAPVEVTFLVYEGTVQAEALALVAAKMRSALMVEGELPADGLATLEGDGQDLFVALARRLVEQSPSDGHSLEALFARTRASETEADGYLATGEWQTDVTPMVSASAPSFPVDGGNDAWAQVFAGDGLPGARVGEGTMAAGSGVMTSFEEPAHLIRRPRSRRKPVPKRAAPALWGIET